jgi:2-C-methyl-D-erythritol 4-phosphate cytidylyltransferase
MNTAIVLAGGSGRRMNSDIPKQYMMLKGKPVIYYSLKAFQDNLHIDDIILVTSDHYIEYVKKNIDENLDSKDKKVLISDLYKFTKSSTSL